MSETTREMLDTLGRVLLRCWILGFVLQVITFGGVLLMREVVYDLYATLFGLSNFESGMVIVGYLALLKLCVLVFFLIPWLAIRLVLKTTKD